MSLSVRQFQSQLAFSNAGLTWFSPIRVSLGFFQSVFQVTFSNGSFSFISSMSLLFDILQCISHLAFTNASLTWSSPMRVPVGALHTYLALLQYVLIGVNQCVPHLAFSNTWDLFFNVVNLHFGHPQRVLLTWESYVDVLGTSSVLITKIRPLFNTVSSKIFYWRLLLSEYVHL